MLNPAPPTPELEAWRTLGEHLRAGGYTAAQVTRTLGLDGWDRETADLIYWDLKVSGEPPLPAWTRLFLQGLPVRVSQVQRTLPPELARLELLEQRGPEVRARRSIVPLEGGDLALADAPSSAVLDPDSVFLPDSSTLAMRRCLPRDRVKLHLDIGCGGGPIALRASRYADQVRLIDINPRAGTMARASFALSGLPIPHAYEGAVEDAPMAGPCQRLSFVLPLLVPWEGMDAAPVHTMADSPDLLADTLSLLPALLDRGGLALLYGQEVTPEATPAELLDAAFGDRPWVGGMWWDDEEPDIDGKMTRVGIMAVRADRPGGWRSIRNIEPDQPDSWWWPALKRDLRLG